MDVPQGVLRELQRGMFLVACCFRGGGELKAAETFGENVVVTETGFRP
jgi:hypothetical protein